MPENDAVIVNILFSHQYFSYNINKISFIVIEKDLLGINETVLQGMQIFFSINTDLTVFTLDVVFPECFSPKDEFLAATSDNGMEVWLVSSFRDDSISSKQRYERNNLCLDCSLIQERSQILTQ